MPSFSSRRLTVTTSSAPLLVLAGTARRGAVGLFSPPPKPPAPPDGALDVSPLAPKVGAPPHAALSPAAADVPLYAPALVESGGSAAVVVNVLVVR